MLSGTTRSPERWLGAPSRTSKMSCRENLETRRIRGRHDQIDASAVPGRDRAVQIDVFADELRGDLGSCADRRPAGPYPIHPAEARFVSEHDAQPPPAPGGSPPRCPHGIGKVAFLKAFCAARSRLG